jgi:predicted SAM-dependent methyltransferase
MKIHFGCGTVYLTPSISDDPQNGWLNIDIAGPHIELARNRPDLVESYSTTPDKYYARHKETVDTMRPGPHKRVGVCDRNMDIRHLDVPSGSVSEVLGRHVLEHLSYPEARDAIAEIERVLAPEGIVTLNVPDTDATIEAIINSKCDPFYIRHLFGTRKDDRGYHLVGHTRDGMISLCREFGLELVREEPNINFYPAFTLVFKKPRVLRPAWEYILPAIGLEIPAHWRVLDVGCGKNPWPRADVLLDCRDYSDGIQYPQQFVQASLAEPLPFDDKEFDFVSAFHVFEHLDCPARAAEMIERVAVRGIVVCPAPWKEGLTLWGEKEHQFYALPSDRRGVLTLKRIDREWRNRVASQEVRDAAYRVFRGEPDRQGDDTALLRRWFTAHESCLDVVCMWEDKLKVEIIE